MPSVLTNTAAIRALSSAEAERGPAVSLDGVVSYGYLPWQLLFIQDAWGGCYVFPTGDVPTLTQGTWIHLEGVLASGLHGPIITSPRIKPLAGPPPGSELPKPRPVELAELANGRDDAQWVETTGVVRAVNGGTSNWSLELGDAQSQVTVQLMASDAVPAPHEWINAVVRVRGVCVVTSNEGQNSSSKLHTSKAGDVVLESPPPAELFQEPLLEPGRLPPTASGLTNAHRVRVVGRVLHVPGSGVVFVADAAGGIRLQGRGLPDLAPGDEVEAAGFATWLDGQWTLAGARVRKLKSGAPPQVLALNDADLLPPAQPMSLIQMEGKLVRWATNGAGISLEITRRRTGESLAAEIPQTDMGLVAAAPLGSLVRVSGLWQARRSRGRAAFLLCRDATDFELVQLPPWWTPKRIAVGVCGLVAGGSALGLWVVTLRRRVRQQTELIREQLQRETALDRRFRELFEQASDAVLFLRPGGEIADLNSTAIGLLRGSREELIGRRFQTFLTENDARRFSDYVRTPGRDSHQGPVEFGLATSDGVARTVEITSCLSHEEAAGAGVQLIAHDITGRKQAEADLARLNREFQQASRLAGMAEVATGVLHNVGNVLNSVNLSATLVVEQLRKSKAGSLTRAAELLREHSGDLGEFLTRDPKGRQVPAYLAALAEQLQREQAVLLRETQGLQLHLDHIKQIVAMQQAFATVSGVLEVVAAPELMEDALRMVQSALARHRVEVQREYGAVPPLLVDRHKVLQILVNLIHNAKDALGARASGRVLTLRIGLAPEAGRVRLEVTDNGAGIAPENLIRIFQHGFTTKADGHGFGLHGGANAAKEMGGSLGVHSAGPGHGATFILELRTAPNGA